jgi:hypothetical protein
MQSPIRSGLDQTFVAATIGSGLDANAPGAPVLDSASPRF